MKRTTLPLHAIAWLVGAFILIPVIYALLGGFKDNGQLSTNPFGLPSPWITSNYTDIISSTGFWRPLFNSILIAVASTVLVVLASAMAAFIFARYAFRGRELLFMVFTAGLMFPFAVAILPLYVLLRQFELLDNPLGVILPQVAFGLPVTIIVLRAFFRTIPAEVEEAAILDGCSPFGFFWRILLPLSRPALVTVAVLAFVASWNAFLLPLLVLQNESLHTLPLGVQNFSAEHSQDTAGILAFTSLAMMPALLFFSFAERQIVGGLQGAVKG